VSVARRKLIAAASAAGLGLGVVTQAAASPGQPPGPKGGSDRPGDRPAVAVLNKPGKHFNESVKLARRRAELAQAGSRSGGSSGSGGGFPSPESIGVSTATLDSIAACESGGDPSAVSADGAYHGKYQFDYGTWASVGGSGDPATASEAEQDYRAALLYSRGGPSAWPICG